MLRFFALLILLSVLTGLLYSFISTEVSLENIKQTIYGKPDSSANGLGWCWSDFKKKKGCVLGQSLQLKKSEFNKETKSMEAVFLNQNVLCIREDIYGYATSLELISKRQNSDPDTVQQIVFLISLTVADKEGFDRVSSLFVTGAGSRRLTPKSIVLRGIEYRLELNHGIYHFTITRN